MTIPSFDRYVCPGDIVNWDKDGWALTAKLVFDDQSTPDEYDCYSPEDIKRWRNDEWFFGGLVIDVYRGEILIQSHAASLWGLECNFSTDNAYLSEVAQELEPEAIASAEENIRKNARVYAQLMEELGL